MKRGQGRICKFAGRVAVDISRVVVKKLGLESRSLVESPGRVFAAVGSLASLPASKMGNSRAACFVNFAADCARCRVPLGPFWIKWLQIFCL